MRVYFLSYGVRQSRLARLRGFFLRDWPAAVRALWRETLIVAAVLLLGVLTSWMLVANQPDWYFHFIPEGMSGGRDPRASVEFLRTTLGHGPAPAGEDQGALHIFRSEEHV